MAKTSTKLTVTVSLTEPTTCRLKAKTPAAKRNEVRAAFRTVYRKPLEEVLSDVIENTVREAKA